MQFVYGNKQKILNNIFFLYDFLTIITKILFILRDFDFFRFISFFGFNLLNDYLDLINHLYFSLFLPHFNNKI